MRIEGESRPRSQAKSVQKPSPAINPLNSLPPIAALVKGERWVLYRWENEEEGDSSVVKPVWARVKLLYEEGKPKSMHNAAGQVVEEVL